MCCVFVQNEKNISCVCVGPNIILHKNPGIMSFGGVSGKHEDTLETCQLPHWTVYIWYFIALSGMIVSAFFTILYSMEWGKAKSERWLTNALISFFLDILFMQPIKVAFIILFIGIVLKKISSTKKLLNSASKYELETCAIQDKPDKFTNGGGLKRKNGVKKHDKNETFNDEEDDLETPKPPTENQLKFAKWNRKNEKRMIDVLYEFLGQCLYILCLMILCNLLRGDSQYNWISELQEIYSDDVGEIQDFWGWVDETVLPNVYREYDYLGNRANWRDRKFLHDNTSYRVGPTRLRQLRRQPNSCIPGSKESKLFWDFGVEVTRAPCNQGNTEKVSIKPGSWYNNPLTDQELEWAFEDGDLWELAWIYQSAEDLRGVPYTGEMKFYEGGGYSAELGVNLLSGKNLTGRLQDAQWIDGYSEAVFLEFTLYNPGVNLFTTVIYAFEFPEFAGTSIIQSDYLAGYQVYSFTDEFGIVLLFCQIIYLVGIIRSIYRLVKVIRLLGFKTYFTYGFWHYIDIVTIVIDLCAVAFYISRELTSKDTLEKFHEDEGKRFVNFAYNALVSQSLISCLAFACFFAILQVLRLLRFNQKVGLLALILKTAGHSMSGMTLAFGIAMVAHGWVLHMLFANHYINFRSFPSTMFNLFTFMLGDDQYENIMTSNSNMVSDIIGKIIFLTFSIIMIMFILNFVISVIDAAMTISQETNQKVNGEDYELARFMQNKFFGLFEGSLDLPTKYKTIMKEKRMKRLLNLEAIGPKLVTAVDELEKRIDALLESEQNLLDIDNENVDVASVSSDSDAKNE